MVEPYSAASAAPPSNPTAVLDARRGEAAAAVLGRRRDLERKRLAEVVVDEVSFAITNIAHDLTRG